LLGKPQEAIELLTQAINLDPKHVDDTECLNMAYAHLMLGDNDAAIEWILKGAEKNPTKVSIYATLAVAYALKGEDAKARAAVDEVHRLDPNWTLTARRRNDSSKPTQYKAWFESNVVPAWRKAGLPE
jgi:predicted Zn-dependent protease